MVNAAVLMPVLAALLAMAVAAALLWPLRRGSWRRSWVGLVATAGLAAPLLYLAVGTPQALQPGVIEAPGNLQEAVAQLERALAREPAHADGWALLGRSQAALGRYSEAQRAYARALTLAPDTPEWLVEAAQIRAQATADQRIDDQGLAWLRHALALAPDNQRARWFLGIAQRQRGQAAEAARTWEPLLAQVDAATAQALRPQIDAARAAAGLPLLSPAQAGRPGATRDQPGPHALAVRVRLAPTVDPARLPAGAQVFVFARTVDGSPIPVAAQRHPATALPLAVTLSDGDSPMPAQVLSAVDEVEVQARLSTDGQAQPRPGDLSSAVVRVRLPASAPVELTLGPAP